MEEHLIIHRYYDLMNSKTRKKCYIKEDLLGKGGFAKCYKIKSRDTHNDYACKIVPKSKLKNKSTLSKLKSEIKIHKFISGHKNIVQYYKWFEDKSFVYIILELCPFKSLHGLLKKRGRFTESEVRYFMAQILSGLRHMHRKQVIHRDLKLGNIFISSDFVLKIGDFGFAAMLSRKGERKMTCCGTPNYIAPEIIDRKRSGHSFEVDVWSLGVIMYTLLTGVPPFESANVKLTYANIKRNEYSFPKDVYVSDCGRNLIKRLLQKDPKNRPSLKQIRFDSFFTKALVAKSLPPTFLEEPPYIKKFKEKLSQSIYSADEAKAFSRSGDPETPKNKNNKQNIKISEKEKLLLKEKDASKGTTTNNTSKTGLKELNDNRGTPKFGRNSILIKSIMDRDLSNFETRTTVVKWLDLSSKYGMAYVLSDGTNGFFFNDCTRMILKPHKKRINYFEETEKGKNTVKNTILKGTNRRISLDASAKNSGELEKKITLLKYFTDYMERKQRFNGGKHCKGTKAMVRSKKQSCESVWVNMWYKTCRANVFCLSNNVFQIIFRNGVQVIFWTVSSGLKGKFGMAKAKEVSRVENHFNVSIKDLGGRTRTHSLYFALEIKDELGEDFLYAHTVLKKVISFPH